MCRTRLCNPFRESAERGTQTPEWGKNSVSSPLPSTLFLCLQRGFPALPYIPLSPPPSPYHTALGYAATKPSINSADVSWQVIFTNHETYGKRETTGYAAYPAYLTLHLTERAGLASATKTALLSARLEFYAETRVYTFFHGQTASRSRVLSLPSFARPRLGLARRAGRGIDRCPIVSVRSVTDAELEKLLKKVEKKSYNIIIISVIYVSSTNKMFNTRLTRTINHAGGYRKNR